MPNLMKKSVIVSNLDVFITLVFIFQPRLPSAGDPRRPNTKTPIDKVWPFTWKLLSRDTKALLDKASKEAEKVTQKKSAVKTSGSLIKGGANKRPNSTESSEGSSSVTNQGTKHRPAKKVHCLPQLK